MIRYPRVLPVGDAAATVELGEAIDPVLNAAVRALDRSLREQPLPGLVETVPTYRSLLVSFDPRAASHAEMAQALLERARLGGDPLPSGPLRTIPTVYGGEHGPDLPAVAAQCGLREDDVVSLHAAREYTAYMVGFMPGFAYLGMTPEALSVPRLTTPRVRVPAGSVALAGRQTGVYPAASPGGWRLIGRTSARLFDPTADPPALIQPGDRVRFRRVDADDPAPLAPPERGRLDPALEVLTPGLLTSVQGGPRRGHRRSGIGVAGPLDEESHAAANRAVGNAPQAAALEVTLVGPALRFLRGVRVAIAGADLTPVLERTDLGTWTVPGGRAFLARPGNVLRFEGRRRGCRAYVAFAGGLEVPLVLGSSSTDLGGGFGGHEGRALRAGDLLAVAAGRDATRGGPAEAAGDAVVSSWPPDDATITLRVAMGPQDDHFSEVARDRFLGVDWDLTAASDRVGCRLRGPALDAAGPREIVSDGMVPGCVQVPPDGQPIVMLADGPTTGGYPKIATVVAADLPRLAQLVPGQGRVRFAAVGAA